MTPERTEQTPDDAEHGVLSDSGSLDTSGLGILGGGTAQVNVAMPAADDDDDFVDDEASIANISEEPSVAATSAEDAARAKAFDVFLSQPIEVESEVGEPAVADTPATAAPVTADEPEADVVDAAAVGDAEDQHSQIEDADVFSTEIEPDRSAIVAPAPVTLTSKRLGEIEADRETADLLTADRLLDPSHVIRSEPEGAWQQLVYSLSLRRINLGDSKRAKARKELDRRIAAPLAGGARFVPVLSRKGGVGKTTVTTLLGMALADARDDRVIAIDANPDRGTLSDRISRAGGKTVRDLVRMSGEVVGFNDLSAMVARDETRLDVVASDADPSVSEAFSDTDYRDVAKLAAHYYSLVLTDTGTGIVHSVMEATLQAADQLVIVAGLSVDEARLASETLTWLETNGYSPQVRNAVVVINSARPGSPVVQLDRLESHFKTRVRTVLRMPYDPHIAAGSAITFRDLDPETRRAARELAASVVEGLRSLASAA
ncbi:AAA family ATPase [Microbacterium sp. NPDC076911]|uniref:MinD/ParA family ATP-binding protein n=1 Tax=Microbacterium sp. NPDC076911 TaxID=3154958 RepID=UPI00343EB7BC